MRRPILHLLYATARRLPLRVRGRLGAWLSRLARWLGMNDCLTVSIGANHLELNPADVWQSYMLTRSYETELEWLITRALPPGGVYVDVGAQLGYTAAIAAQRVGAEGKLILMEPDPRILPKLKKNVAVSLAQKTAQVVESACTDTQGTVELRLLDTLGWARIDTANSDRTPGEKSVAIKAETLSDLLDRLQVANVDLIKIDVEGHEIPVIRGMGPQLQSKQIGIVCIEKHLHLLAAEGYTALHLHAMFDHYGYFGCFEDGEPIRIKDLNLRSLENLIYFRTEDLYAEVFDRPYKAADHDNALDAAWEEASDISGLYPKQMRVVSRARTAGVPAAIPLAEKLLAEHPDATVIPGHLAYWYSLVGDHAKSEALYAEIVRRDPTNLDARRLWEAALETTKVAERKVD